MRSLQLFLGAYLAGTHWMAGEDELDAADDSTSVAQHVPGTHVDWKFLAARRRRAAHQPSGA